MSFQDLPTEASQDLPTGITRKLIADKYLSGNGIEIGALHNPLPVSKNTAVRYVDRMPVSDLKTHYPELARYNLVDIDIVDDGESLHTVKNDTQDFVIANHFIEHCKNPIAAIISMFRVLKSGGIIYLAIPDKRYNFDKIRENTSFDHLAIDHRQGPSVSKKKHFEEWTLSWNQITDPEKAKKRVEYLMGIDYSIHYHVWTSDTFLDFLFCLKKEFLSDFQVLLFLQNEDECITILKKGY
ncbi:MAG: methyltransferase domain-containing protein [Desulfobacteraceae bacterium]|nr:MAG: methyltransferase domain-containing protein [Desulfobacteraceae bacterium]